MTSNKPIIILGGKGKTGSRVAQRLEALGLPTRFGSRSTTPSFDWDDRSTWGPAIEGASAIFFAYQPDLSVPQARDDMAEITALAKQAGISRIVTLVGRNEAQADPAEQVLIEAGGTMLRCAWFSQNFCEGMFAEGVMAGEVALPVSATIREAFIDVDDIADVAVKALTEDGHRGQIYELSGPRLITFPEAVAEVARASGRNVKFHSIGLEDYKAGAREAGLPDDIVDLLDMLFNETLDGRNEHVTDTVQRVLGRPARDFADYARDAAAAGRWTS